MITKVSGRLIASHIFVDADDNLDIISFTYLIRLSLFTYLIRHSSLRSAVAVQVAYRLLIWFFNVIHQIYYLYYMNEVSNVCVFTLQMKQI